MIRLKKNPDQDFIILNLSDPQLSDDEWGLNGEETEAQVRYKVFLHTARELVDRVKPDLITISGDISYPNCQRAYQKFGDFFDSFRIPWAVIWGNHDNQWDLEALDRTVDLFSTYRYFVFEAGDRELGSGNYVITIEEEGRPVEGMVMMDTHDVIFYSREEDTEQDVLERDDADLMRTHREQIEMLAERGHEEKELSWINPKLTRKQVSWYREQIQQLTELGCKDTTLITHVPIYAYTEAFRAALKEGIDPLGVSLEESYGAECWNEGYEESLGVVHEKRASLGSYPVDDGVFDAVLEMGTTKTILCGHCHANNFVTTYRGVKFAYALKTGPGCYWRPYLNGGTVLLVGSEGMKELYHEYVDGDIL